MGITPERVPPLAPGERDERQSALVAAAGAEFGVYTTLVRNTDLFADFLPFGTRLLGQSTLGARVRELVILRVAWRCHAPYIWSHHEVIGRSAGLTDDDLTALTTETTETPVLRAADELVADHRLSDPTWHAVADRYPPEQIIELCLLAGQYAMLAGTLNSLGVQLEDGFPLPDWA